MTITSNDSQYFNIDILESGYTVCIISDHAKLSDHNHGPNLEIYVFFIFSDLPSQIQEIVTAL